jgi:ferredoxin
MDDIYHKLARHLEHLLMGYPYSEALLNLLAEMFTPEEAGVLLGLPNDLFPLETVSASEAARNLGRSPDVVEPVLERLAQQNLVFTGPTPRGEKGYALLQVGYGLPQVFFWSGRLDQRAKRMGGLVYRYFHPKVTSEIYGGTPTKSYRYIPVGQAVETPCQGVMPYDSMGKIIEEAELIAVGHCPCRVSARAAGRSDCRHSLEVCLKYDEMARFTLDQKLTRRISKDEALHILKQCEEEGLVHMVDNAQGKVKHTCNCCGCYCWNVGLINRRKVPRDQIMAVYFLRETNQEECIGCGACAEICPVNAVRMEEDAPVVDMDWCIGCGVCAVSCPTGAISLKRRFPQEPPLDLRQMFEQIRQGRPPARTEAAGS